MTSDKADGETGILQLNISSSPSDLQLLCRSEGCSELCCLCMSGRLLEQAAQLIVRAKNFLLVGLLLCEVHQENSTHKPS